MQRLITYANIYEYLFTIECNGTKHQNIVLYYKLVNSRKYKIYKDSQMDYKQVMNKDDFSPFESNPILFEKII